MLKFLGFMWNPLSWVMEAAAIMAIVLANGGVITSSYCLPSSSLPSFQFLFSFFLLIFVFCFLFFFLGYTKCRVRIQIGKILLEL